MFATQPMAGPFGVRIEAIDVRSLDDARFADLARLLFANRIVVIPGQSLTNADYVAFGRRWGNPIDFIARKNTLGGFPEMIVQSNRAATPGVLHNNASHWHCDSSYEPVPASVTMLLGVETPEAGGVTLFADLIAAYAALPDATRTRLEGLLARHMPGRGALADGEHMVRYDTMEPEFRANADRWGPVEHPIVGVHPYSGEKGLYGLGGTPYAIAGLDEGESTRLRAELKAHATQPRFVQHYKLMPGDIILWDNFGVMHRATPIAYVDEERSRRLNYRISVKGLPPVLAPLAMAATI